MCNTVASADVFVIDSSSISKGSLSSLENLYFGSQYVSFFANYVSPCHQPIFFLSSAAVHIRDGKSATLCTLGTYLNSKFRYLLNFFDSIFDKC